MLHWKLQEYGQESNPSSPCASPQTRLPRSSGTSSHLGGSEGCLCRPSPGHMAEDELCKNQLSNSRQLQLHFSLQTKYDHPLLIRQLPTPPHGLLQCTAWPFQLQLNSSSQSMLALKKWDVKYIIYLSLPLDEKIRIKNIQASILAWKNL